MMQRMGLSMNPMEVEEVVLRTKEKEITIEDPEVAVLEMQGQKIFQVTGGHLTEKALEKKLIVPEEDVQLVAQQAKVTLERARAALEQTGGDLAQAILLLSQG
jgi:nascent polypeptide-associated complex subunit alpha